MDIFTILKQFFCKHKYRKHWDKKHGYVQQCVKCGKIEGLKLVERVQEPVGKK